MKLSTLPIRNRFAPGLIVRDLKRPEVVFRQLTWKKRALPDFIIIGAQKSGTTSLHHYLCQHPQIVRPNKKEVHYFDGGLSHTGDNYEKGLAWYRSHFPYEENIAENQLTFEASPLYIYHPLAPKRIKALLPEVKIIALLRNPVDRAISHYFHSRRKGAEDRPILEALQGEEETLGKVIANNDFDSPDFAQKSYKSRGLYGEQLKRYYDLFPEENIFVASSEEFFSNPKATLKNIYEFLRIDSGFVISDLSIKNLGDDKEDVEKEVITYLEDYYQQENEKLFLLTGKRFPW